MFITCEAKSREFFLEVTSSQVVVVVVYHTNSKDSKFERGVYFIIFSWLESSSDR